MPNLILFNKPFQVLSKFTEHASDKKTLASFLAEPGCAGFYPAGRLDYDSEGLLALTNDGALQHRIAAPALKMAKTYWVQVEGTADETQIRCLRQGVTLKDGDTSPALAEVIETPPVWPRQPPIRNRSNVPTCWLQLTITEGRNRQVRRMTAAVGLPTLRLIRSRIGPWSLGQLMPGEFRFADVHLPKTAPAAHQKRNKRKFRQR